MYIGIDWPFIKSSYFASLCLLFVHVQLLSAWYKCSNYFFDFTINPKLLSLQKEGGINICSTNDQTDDVKSRILIPKTQYTSQICIFYGYLFQSETLLS